MQNTTKRRVNRGVRETIAAHWVWFLAFTAAALALRFLFVFRFGMITPDSLVYGDLAKNWTAYHVYGLTGPDGPVPTDIRLPGYPAYLALWFLLSGMEHYGGACIAQTFVDVATCFVVAAIAHRLAGERAAKWAFALAALCPFTANYTALPLTETAAIFFAALAMWFGLRGCEALRNSREPMRMWLWSGLAIGAGTLLRPDGGMLWMAMAGWLGWRFVTTSNQRRIIIAGALVTLGTYAPLVPWAIRNAITLHEFQPLAPATAAGPEEFYPHGFVRWQNTWLADYASLEDIGFNVSGDKIPFTALPSRAYDNDQQRRRTQQLFDAYNAELVMTPELDAQFAALARERVKAAPLRFYLRLPVMRALDMWFRPRTEMLPVDQHWWRFDDPQDAAIAWLAAAINLALIGVAAWTLRGWRTLPYVSLLLTFVAVRTLLITAIATPEPRYMLECYPVVLALAGAAARTRPALKVIYRVQEIASN